MTLFGPLLSLASSGSAAVQFHQTGHSCVVQHCAIPNGSCADGFMHQPAVKLAIIHEVQDRFRGELCPFIADHRLGLAAGVEQRGQLPRHPCPDSDVSSIRARHSRVQSSATVMIRNRRQSVSWSDTKSNDPRWFGIRGSTIGARVPMARLRPPRRRTCNCSSR